MHDVEELWLDYASQALQNDEISEEDALQVHDKQYAATVPESDS